MNAPKRSSSGSAFRDRLSSFMSDDDDSKSAPLSRAEQMRLAKEKKRLAKIDADFKKQMKKRGF